MYDICVDSTFEPLTFGLADNRTINCPGSLKPGQTSDKYSIHFYFKINSAGKQRVEAFIQAFSVFQ